MIVSNGPIGIFDSGIGGLSIVEDIKRLLPNEPIIYLSDKKNFPYGDKIPEKIKEIARRNAKFLIDKKCKLIVVACNTATVNAINYLREEFPYINFVGVEPAVKPAGKLSKKGIIVLSSPRATKSKQLKSLINRYASGTKVFNIGSIDLVHAVEEKWNSRRIENLLDKLLPQKVLKQADELVLGCTHFPLIKDDIQKHAGKKIKVIDSGEAVARRVKSVLEEDNLLNSEKKPTYKYYTSGVGGNILDIRFVPVEN
jgi:glutamate racemase